MPDTFHLSLITPERVFFEGEATMVTAPGTVGEFGVLAGHAPFISSLKPGLITVAQNGGRQRISILGGIVEVTQDHCNILAETAQSLERLTTAEAQSQLLAARDALAVAHTDELKATAQEKLTLAEIVAGAVS